MPTAVHDGDDGDKPGCGTIDHKIRKPTEQGHTRLSVNLWEDVGMATDERQTGVKAAEKVSAQSRRLALVPVRCLPYVVLGGIANDYRKAHGFR
jgi:hypothetical protein